MSDVIFGRIIKCCLLIGCLVLLGTCGYVLLEGWPANDGFYMTIITMSTVGFGETRELTPAGRLFTTLLIICSIISMSCWTAVITSSVVGGDLSGAFLRKRALKMAARMTDHTIVCGSGSMAEAVVDRLVRAQIPVVVVDGDSDHIESMRKKFPDVPIVQQNPTNEIALANANLLSATHVAAVTDSEFDNLLISMTCKDLHSNVNVFALSNDTAIASRMLKAGVDEVICPSQLGGDRIAEQILD